MCIPQLRGGVEGASEDHDARGHHRLRAGTLPARPAGGVHGQTRLPLEAAGLECSRAVLEYTVVKEDSPNQIFFFFKPLHQLGL